MQCHLEPIFLGDGKRGTPFFFGRELETLTLKFTVDDRRDSTVFRIRLTHVLRLWILRQSWVVLRGEPTKRTLCLSPC